MAERYELKIPRVGADGKNYSTKIGVMFPWKNKDGFNLIFFCPFKEVSLDEPPPE